MPDKINQPQDVRIKQMKAEVNLAWNQTFGKERTERFETAQKFVDSECIRLMVPYTPALNNILYKSAALGTKIGSGQIVYASPLNGFWSQSISSVNNNGSTYYAVFMRNAGTYNSAAFGVKTITLSTEPTKDDWTNSSKYLFYVSNNGKLYAENAEIKGTITATSGSFTGTVTATSGTIGGWTIKDTYLAYTAGSSYGSNSTCVLCPAGTSNSYSVGGSSSLSGWVARIGSGFGVTTSGKLYATGAVITGEITATSGSFVSQYNSTDTLKLSGATIDLLAYPAQIRYKSASGTMCNALRYIPSSNYGDVGLIVGNENSSLYLKGYTISQEQYISSSDLRLKKDINSFSSKFENFFLLLEPVNFKFINGTSDRTHSGFIAQQVKSAAEQSGLTTQDIAVYVEYESSEEFDGYKCGLRYDEFIALNTHMIQKCLAEIKALKDEISILKQERTE